MNTDTETLDNQVDFKLDFNNFNPEEVETEETINIVFAIDVSPSIQSYEDELNAGLNEFYETMQKSHVADKVMVSTITFNEKINVENGFQPIANLNPADYHASGSSTSLYDAVLAALQNAITYRNDLQKSGVTVKTLLFVITDGMDNSSKESPSLIKDMISDITKDEKNVFTFSSVLFGIGQEEDYFKEAQEDMGIQHGAAVGTTGAEIRKMINLISSSVTSASNNQPVSF